MSAGISAQGRRDLAEVVAAGGRFIEPADAVAALGLDATTAARKLARWAEQGWVRRVRRGLYIAVPVEAPNPSAWSEDPLVVASRVWAPCYFTGWTAARRWDLTEQVFQTTVVRTSERVRTPRPRLLDHDYLLSHVAPDAMSWGLVTEWRGDSRLMFATPARTVVEILDDPRLGGGIRHGAEVIQQYFEDHEILDLVEAATRFGSGAVFKRLGYLIEALQLDQPELLAICLERRSAGITILDPSGPAQGHRDPHWGLKVNVTIRWDGPS
jgi:predicted transcriptional regulator of viral defense system